jgi:cytochrome c553
MILTDLLMGFVFILLFGFALWLIWITYFREYFDTGIIESSKLTAIEELKIAGMNKQNHFHNLDESVLKIAKSLSVCVKCHGSYPHSKSNHIRAFLNAHAYFMACEVCHLDEKKRSIATFKWLDDRTGLAMDFFPTKLRAKIVPVEKINGSLNRLDISRDRRFVEEYLTHRNTLDADQEAAAKLRIHRNVSDDAIVCDDCHTATKTSYLPYASLHYSQERISAIAGTEVTGMIKKYKKFYLPSLLEEKPF